MPSCALPESGCCPVCSPVVSLLPAPLAALPGHRRCRCFWRWRGWGAGTGRNRTADGRPGALTGGYSGVGSGGRGDAGLRVNACRERPCGGSSRNHLPLVRIASPPPHASRHTPPALSCCAQPAAAARRADIAAGGTVALAVDVSAANHARARYNLLLSLMVVAILLAFVCTLNYAIWRVRRGHTWKGLKEGAGVLVRIRVDLIQSVSGLHPAACAACVCTLNCAAPSGGGRARL